MVREAHAEGPEYGKRHVWPFFVVGAVLVLTALLLLVNRGYGSLQAGTASMRVLEVLDEHQGDSYVVAPQERLETGRFEMPYIVVGDFKYVGRIVIPALDLVLPLSSRCTDESLEISPGCYRGTYADNDLVVCGEGYEAHFGRISQLGIRDEVKIVTVDGVLYRYIVSNIENDRMEDIDAILDDWDLTLFTFNADGTCLVVRCVRVESVLPD